MKCIYLKDDKLSYKHFTKERQSTSALTNRCEMNKESGEKHTFK